MTPAMIQLIITLVSALAPLVPEAIVAISKISSPEELEKLLPADFRVSLEDYEKANETIRAAIAKKKAELGMP